MGELRHRRISEVRDEDVRTPGAEEQVFRESVREITGMTIASFEPAEGAGGCNDRGRNPHFPISDHGAGRGTG
jgi:hypothetical protein